MATDLPPLSQFAISALQESARAFDAQRIAYALIGGVAAGYRSRPRATRDLDFVVQVPQIHLPGLLNDLEQRGFEFDLPQVIRQYVQEHMTVLSYHGIRVDWLKPMLPFYQHVIDRARVERFLDVSIRVAAPESLILTKLLAFRSQDQIDIENLLAANRGQLDLEFIRAEWSTVADSDDPRMQRFEQMVGQYYAPPPSDTAT